VHTKRANTIMPLSISDKSITLGTMVDALWISSVVFISSSVRNRTDDLHTGLRKEV
jgi:hypothetical protein